MSKFNLDEYNPVDSDKFFLDTNVWMYLYCSIGNYKEDIVDKYNELYYKILDSGASIYTCALQLSEFFNAYCKLEYNITKEAKGYNNYKRDFRDTEQFIELTEQIQMIIKNKILKNSHRLDDLFNDINIDDIFTIDKGFDFNDQFFTLLCEKYEISMVSNDRDILKNAETIDVLTALK
ncbi:type II toxin-antitoxin system VapC family toxin [Bacillus pumilus]|uniref:type II toxin-antitoxin system VapC family toxin n=1 Tax=Bacillus pumilus TaxID=1408 RepID=UPI001C21BD12|nr:type II toxin-antitoxin system VapC family toxin [Bacillus pumilus]MBU8576988.1 type II toxin-antitoxin system VapC family toxin [Bacillus pumilus]